MVTATTADPGGRPRRTKGPASEDAILRSAFQLVEEEGLRAATVEAIAKRAGVSKVTIYKWWPNRAAVIMSAFLREAPSRMPYPISMHRGHIHEVLLQVAHEFRGSTGAMIRALVAEGESDPEIAEAFRRQYMQSRRADGLAVIQKAIDAGDIRQVDPWAVMDLLYGPLVLRLLIGHEKVTDEFVEAHADLVWRAIAPEGDSPSADNK